MGGTPRGHFSPLQFGATPNCSGEKSPRRVFKTIYIVSRHLDDDDDDEDGGVDDDDDGDGDDIDDHDGCFLLLSFHALPLILLRCHALLLS